MIALKKLVSADNDYFWFISVHILPADFQQYLSNMRLTDHWFFYMYSNIRWVLVSYCQHISHSYGIKKWKLYAGDRMFSLLHRISSNLRSQGQTPGETPPHSHHPQASSFQSIPTEILLSNSFCLIHGVFICRLLEKFHSSTSPRPITMVTDRSSSYQRNRK